MNIRLYSEVIRRHWLILTVGFVLATGLAAFSAFSINLFPPSLSWKLKPTYSARSVLLVRQTNDPELADPAAANYLSGLYAQLATSDEVISAVVGKNGLQHGGQLVLDGGRAVGSYTAQQLTAPVSGIDSPSPFIEIDATADSASAAKEIGARATNALIRFGEAGSSSEAVAGKERVSISVIAAPDDARVVKGRSLVKPLAVFVLFLAAAVMLAFVRENVKRDERLDRTHQGSVPSVVTTSLLRADAPGLGQRRGAGRGLSPH